MSDIKKLTEKIRSGLNKNIGREIAKSVSSTEELIQVSSWIEMPQYFKDATGGKGFPCGHITQIVGESDTGKSTLIMEAMKSCQTSGGVVFLLDSEHKFSFDRYKIMGGCAEDIITISVDSLEEAWDAIKEIGLQVEQIRKDNPELPILLCWDSVAASVPDSVLDADAEQKHVAVDAKINNQQVRRLRQMIRKLDISAIMINHSYMTMPPFPKEVIKGGSELYFMSTLILKTRRRGWIKRTIKGLEQKYGVHCHLDVMKGHLSGRKTKTEFYIVEHGILNNMEEVEDYKKTLRGKL